MKRAAGAWLSFLFFLVCGCLVSLQAEETGKVSVSDLLYRQAALEVNGVAMTIVPEMQLRDLEADVRQLSAQAGQLEQELADIRASFIDFRRITDQLRRWVRDYFPDWADPGDPGEPGGPDPPEPPQPPLPPVGEPRPAPEYAAHFLWKPVSENDGRLVCLTPPQTAGRHLRGFVGRPDGITEWGRFTGETQNGARPHYRFSKPGSAYGQTAFGLVLRNEGTVVWYIPNGANRYDDTRRAEGPTFYPGLFPAPGDVTPVPPPPAPPPEPPTPPAVSAPWPTRPGLWHEAMSGNNDYGMARPVVNAARDGMIPGSYNVRILHELYAPWNTDYPLSQAAAWAQQTRAQGWDAIVVDPEGKTWYTAGWIEQLYATLRASSGGLPVFMAPKVSLDLTGRYIVGTATFEQCLRKLERNSDGWFAWFYGDHRVHIRMAEEYARHNLSVPYLFIHDTYRGPAPTFLGRFRRAEAPPNPRGYEGITYRDPETGQIRLASSGYVGAQHGLPLAKWCAENRISFMLFNPSMMWRFDNFARYRSSIQTINGYYAGLQVLDEVGYELFGRPWSVRRAQRQVVADQPWCSICRFRGSDDVPLTGHHIIPWSVAPELGSDLSNLISLCRNCHFTWGHGQASWRAYVPNVRELAAQIDQIWQTREVVMP